MYNSIKYFPRAITVKAVIEPQLGIVSQLEESLQLYGFLQEIKKFPDLFKPLYVANSSSMFDVKPDEFLTNVVITYSKKQLEKQAEEDTYKHFCDFIEFLFDDGSNYFKLFLFNETNNFLSY